MILWCKDSYTSTEVIRHLHVIGEQTIFTAEVYAYKVCWASSIIAILEDAILRVYSVSR